MFDVGFQEIVLIGVIALLIIGPERLPAVARSVGLWVGKMQRFVAGVKSDIHNELKSDELRSLLNSQEDQIRELKDMVNETRTDLERTAKSATESLSEGMDQAVDQVRDAAEATRTSSAKMEAIKKAAGYGESAVGAGSETNALDTPVVDDTAAATGVPNSPATTGSEPASPDSDVTRADKSA